MKAVVIATDYYPEATRLNERLPLCLLPLVDRPFIQHVVETIVDQGVSQLDFVLNHLPEKIEHLLGDGRRWGSVFRYHLARDPRRPYRALQTLVEEADGEPLLLVHADRLPDIQMGQLAPLSSLPALIASKLDDEWSWTGWALLRGAAATDGLPIAELDERALEARLMERARRCGAFLETAEVLSVQSPARMLMSQRKVLNKRFPALALSGKEADHCIWLSRNVSLHPTTRLIPPVYIGESCRIGRGVRLGPNAVIGNDCVLDARCTVSNSLVFQGSYVGEGLELADVIVDRNRLINVRVGVAVSVVDDFILGSLAEKHLVRALSDAFSRFAAVVLLALAWPVLLATALWLSLTRKGPVLTKREAVKLPTHGESAGWRAFKQWTFYSPESCEEAAAAPAICSVRGFFLAFLPALVNVAKGELHFVGVKPRSRAEIEALPHDWQTLYLRAKAGLVTEAELLYGPWPAEDDLYSAEAFYSVTAGFRHDLKLLGKYCGCVIAGAFSGQRLARNLEAR